MNTTYSRYTKIFIFTLMLSSQIAPSFSKGFDSENAVVELPSLPQILEKAINHFSLLTQGAEIVETRMEKKKGSELLAVVKDGPSMILESKKQYWRVGISASLRKNEVPLNFFVLIDCETGAIVSNSAK